MLRTFIALAHGLDFSFSLIDRVDESTAVIVQLFAAEEVVNDGSMEHHSDISLSGSSCSI